MSDKQSPRIFVVEDHPLMLFGIEKYLESKYDLVGSAGEVHAAVDGILEAKPDLVLLDVRIPGGGGALVVEAVRESEPGVKFLAYTVSTSAGDVSRLLQAGVVGYVVKTTEGSELQDHIDRALAGGHPLSRYVASHLLEFNGAAKAEGSLETLDPSDVGVLILVARGFTFEEVAKRLEIRPEVLDERIGRILERLEGRFDHDLARLIFLFSDIEGSTALAGQVGDEAWAKAIEWHDDTIRSIVEANDGTVVKALGDGVMACFESARDAATAALEIQDAFAARRAPPELKIRIGLHIGSARHVGDDYLGSAVIKAARVMATASPGSISVSSELAVLLEEESSFQVGSPQIVELKGIEGRHEVVTLSPGVLTAEE